MFDWVDLRLNQQGDTKADDSAHEAPRHTQNGFHAERDTALATAEPQPLIDRIEQSFEPIHQPTKCINNQREEADHQMHSNAIPSSGHEFTSQLFGVAPKSRVEC